MSETKKAPRIVYNHGTRTYTLKNGPNGEIRRLVPNGSIEALDEVEFKALIGNRDLSDARKLAPALSEKIEALEKEKAELLKENEELKAQLEGEKKRGKGSKE